MNIAIGLEYDGRNYRGFQRQKDFDSVQGRLEAALAQVAGEPVETRCAGRTDAGVHAAGQVAGFATAAARPERAWVLGVNAHLPRDISVRWAREVPGDFDARRSATSRRYRYVILNTRSRPGVLNGRVAHCCRGRLDEEAMHRAAQCLVGEHDFSAFRGAGCESRTPWRNVTAVSVSRAGDYVFIDVAANAFLLHMVRNIAGSLVAVGEGLRPPEWIAEIFAGRDRTRAGPTAPPDGLYLAGVSYPARFGLPENPGPTPFLLI